MSDERMCFSGPRGEAIRFPGSGGSLNHAELDEAVARCRTLMSELDGNWVLGLTDPAAVLVASLAAWSMGRKVAFPASLTPQALEEACRETEGNVAVSSSEGGVGGLRLDLSRVMLAEPDPNFSGLGELSWAADSVCAVFFTSGSTGSPTACFKTARQLWGEARLQAELWLRPSGTGPLGFCSVPPYHIYGFLFGVLSPALSGLPFVARPQSIGPEYVQLLAETAASHLISTPAHLTALLTAPASQLQRLRVIISSGAPLDGSVCQGLVNRFRVSVTEVLGSTETGGIATRTWGPAPIVTAPDSRALWSPLPGISVEHSEGGRMLLRSPFLAPEQSQPMECADRAERVGTQFRHLGRSDRVVKVAGKRIELGALEREVRTLDGVTDARALARPSPGLRGTEVLLVVSHPLPGCLTVDRVRAHLGCCFDPVVLPRRYRFVKALPRTDTGKVTQAALLSLFHTSATEAP